jgi:dienelactone hydrolase
MLGAYGGWAASLAPDPPPLSFRHPRWVSLEAWRDAARARLVQALAPPETGPVQPPKVRRRSERDGLHVEELVWTLPYGPPTEALLLKPAGAQGPLPGVLALHDHGGDRWFGLGKIARGGREPHPLMQRHQERYYGGVAWADELARRGFTVLVHDVFPFGSRRLRPSDLPAGLDAPTVPDNGSEEAVAAYNRFMAGHEHVVARSLLAAGTTFPGVVVAEDRRALDHLCARPDVDPARIGCYGLSGGGLRAVHLAGLDPRIACAGCTGMMTTWRDFALHRSHRHSWMVYLPGLPLELDYPDILSLAAPAPTLVQSNREDALFTASEVERAHRALAEVYAKVGATDRHRGSFHEGPHKLDRAMQEEAFAWLARWLVR